MRQFWRVMAMGLTTAGILAVVVVIWEFVSHPPRRDTTQTRGTTRAVTRETLRLEHGHTPPTPSTPELADGSRVHLKTQASAGNSGGPSHSDMESPNQEPPGVRQPREKDMGPWGSRLRLAGVSYSARYTETDAEGDATLNRVGVLGSAAGHSASNLMSQSKVEPVRFVAGGLVAGDTALMELPCGEVFSPSDVVLTAVWTTASIPADWRDVTVTWVGGIPAVVARSVQLPVNRRWATQIDAIRLIESEWPVGEYYVRVHGQPLDKPEPEVAPLLAEGRFVIRADAEPLIARVRWRVNGVEQPATALVVPDAMAVVTLEFTASRLVGPVVDVRLVGPTGVEVTHMVDLFNVDPTQPYVVPLAGPWLPGRHRLSMVASLRIMAQHELFVKPAAPSNMPKQR